MIEFFNDIGNTLFLREPAEFFTIVISFTGLVLAFAHSMRFNRTYLKTAKRMKYVFLTDAAVYAVTMVMGVALYFNLPLIIHYDVIIRPLVLFLNVYASVRLFNHFRNL